MRVPAPLLVGGVRCWQEGPQGADPLSADLVADRESLQAVQPVHPLVIDLPPFPPQQWVEATIARAYSNASEFAQAQAQWRLVLRATLVAIRRPVRANHATGAPLAGAKADLNELHQEPLLGRLQRFFLITSWSRWRSTVRSATSGLSR
jgi:hypothetical protein